jgi:hypothetical protein
MDAPPAFGSGFDEVNQNLINFSNKAKIATRLAT